MAMNDWPRKDHNDDGIIKAVSVAKDVGEKGVSKLARVVGRQ